MDQTATLPPQIKESLDEFLEAAKQAFGDDLLAAVLFGSAAEGRMRSSSDVNLLLFLRRFDKGRADLVREPYRTAHAAMRLDVMFLLESELEQVMDAFALKFSDIMLRRRVLLGTDPFANLVIPPEAVRRRTGQVLLNLMLRMRERYALVSLREEQLVHVAAEMAGPLRACAASILALEGKNPPSPMGALSLILAEPGAPGGSDMTKLIDTARREGALPSGMAAPLIFSLMELAEFMYGRLSGTPAAGGACHG